MSNPARRGRPQRPIDPTSPAAQFADDLRRMLNRADLTYGQLANETGYAKSTVSRALSGQQLPSWEIVERFLTAVGTGDRMELREWKQRWSSIADPMAPVHADVRFDPNAPIFYLGHARAAGPARGQGLVERLYNDLAMHIGELLALRTGQSAGFLDSGIRSGELWQREVLYAIGSCHVYVPLLSPRYLTSSWCRFEWETFTARTVATRHGEPIGTQTAVIPVLWTPTDRATLPLLIQRVQMFAPGAVPPGVLESYIQEGLYGLMQLQMDREYQAIVWRLAQRIVDTTMRYQVEPLVPDDTNGLGPSFMDDAER